MNNGYQYAPPVSGGTGLNREPEQKKNSAEKEYAEYKIDEKTQEMAADDEFIRLGVRQTEPLVRAIAEIMKQQNIQCVGEYQGRTYESKPKLTVDKAVRLVQNNGRWEQQRDNYGNPVFRTDETGNFVNNANISVQDGNVKLTLELDDKSIKFCDLNRELPQISRISSYSFNTRQRNTELTPNLRKFVDVLQQTGIVAPEQTSVLQNANIVSAPVLQNQSRNQNNYQNNRQNTPVGVSRDMRTAAQNNPTIGNMLSATESFAKYLAEEMQRNGIHQPNTMWVSVKEGRNGGYNAGISIKDGNTSLYMNLDSQSLTNGNPKFYSVLPSPQNAPLTPDLQNITRMLNDGGYIQNRQQNQQRTNQSSYNGNNNGGQQRRNPVGISRELREQANANPDISMLLYNTEQFANQISNDFKPTDTLWVNIGQGQYGYNVSLSMKDQNTAMYVNLNTKSIQEGNPRISSVYPEINALTPNQQFFLNELKQNGYMYEKQNQQNQNYAQNNNGYRNNGYQSQQNTVYSLGGETEKRMQNDAYIRNGVQSAEVFAQNLSSQLQQRGIQASYIGRNGNTGTSKLWIDVDYNVKDGNLVRDSQNNPKYKATVSLKDGNASLYMNLSDSSIKSGEPKVVYTQISPKGTAPTPVLQAVMNILKQEGYMYETHQKQNPAPITAMAQNADSPKVSIADNVDRNDPFIMEGVKVMKSRLAEDLSTELHKNGINAVPSVFVGKNGNPPAYMAKVMVKNNDMLLNLYANDTTVRNGISGGKPTFDNVGSYSYTTRTQGGFESLNPALQKVVQIAEQAGMMQNAPLQKNTIVENLISNAQEAGIKTSPVYEHSDIHEDNDAYLMMETLLKKGYNGFTYEELHEATGYSGTVDELKHAVEVLGFTELINPSEKAPVQQETTVAHDDSDFLSEFEEIISPEEAFSNDDNDAYMMMEKLTKEGFSGTYAELYDAVGYSGTLEELKHDVEAFGFTELVNEPEPVQQMQCQSQE